MAGPGAVSLPPPQERGWGRLAGEGAGGPVGVAVTGKLYLGFLGGGGGLYLVFFGGSPANSDRVSAGRSPCEEPAFSAAGGKTTFGWVMDRGSSITSRSRGEGGR